MVGEFEIVLLVVAGVRVDRVYVGVLVDRVVAGGIFEEPVDDTTGLFDLVKVCERIDLVEAGLADFELVGVWLGFELLGVRVDLVVLLVLEVVVIVVVVVDGCRFCFTGACTSSVFFLWLSSSIMPSGTGDTLDAKTKRPV